MSERRILVAKLYSKNNRFPNAVPVITMLYYVYHYYIILTTALTTLYNACDAPIANPLACALIAPYSHVYSCFGRATGYQE
jgi:hypothetical protein